MKERTYHLVGWMLFLASSVLYTVSAWRSGDPAGLIGSVLFLLACLLFVIPMLREPP
jgi:predicted membrane channel-forming protein YqfA (hemolysin III family)